MSDFGDAIEHALGAARAVPAAQDWSPERDRAAVLKDVIDRLPRELQRCPRADLEARIHDRRLLAAVSGWRWGGGSLVLAGGTGRGKTTAAAHLVRRLCAEAARHGGEAFEKSQFIRWQECRALSRVAREARLGTGTPEEFVRCQNARLLILDDLGTTDDRESLELILQVRNQRAWPTITTTGMVTDEITAFLGDALARRLFECGAHKGAIVDTETATP